MKLQKLMFSVFIAGCALSASGYSVPNKGMIPSRPMVGPTLSPHSGGAADNTILDTKPRDNMLDNTETKSRDSKETPAEGKKSSVSSHSTPAI